MIKHSNPTFDYVHNQGKIEAWEEVIAWCSKEIPRIKRAEERANDNIGGYSRIQQLKTIRRVFQLRATKLRDEMAKEPIRF